MKDIYQKIVLKDWELTIQSTNKSTDDLLNADIYLNDKKLLNFNFSTWADPSFCFYNDLFLIWCHGDLLIIKCLENIYIHQVFTCPISSLLLHKEKILIYTELSISVYDIKANDFIDEFDVKDVIMDIKIDGDTLLVEDFNGDIYKFYI